MEKPELEKIIKELENIGLEGWVCDDMLCYSEHKISTRLHGLTFVLEKQSNPAVFKKSFSYSLEITLIENYHFPEQNRYIHTLIAYPSHDKNRESQQKMIGDLYEKVSEGIRKHREAELKEMLTDFLGFEIDDIYKSRTFSQLLIEKLEGLDKNLWTIEKDKIGINLVLKHNGLIFLLYGIELVESPTHYCISVSNQKRDIETVIRFDNDQGRDLYKDIFSIVKKREEEIIKERIDHILID